MFPLYVRAGGVAENPDKYTIDQTWYSGGSWSFPILDGGQQYGGSRTTLGSNATIINDYIYTPSNVIINSLQLQNIGDPSDGSGTAIQFVGGGSSIEIKNCILNPHAIQAFGYSNGTGTSNHIHIHDNQIMNAGRAVVYGRKGAVTNDVQVYRNTWQGPGTTFGSFHLDGLMIGCPVSCTGGDPVTVTNIQFFGNYFYGSWPLATAQYYSNGWTGNTTIYNNVFSFENASCSSGVCLSPSFVAFGGNDTNISIYSNTFSSDAVPGSGGVAVAAVGIYNSPASPGSLVIEGNIFSGTPVDIAINPVAAFSPITMNYNLHNASSKSRYWVVNGYTGTGNFHCNSVATCTAHGVEADSVGSFSYSREYAGFIAIPNGTTGSGNWQLQSSSPAINAFPAAAAPTSVFNADINGVTRPQGSAWDIGAYQKSLRR